MDADQLKNDLREGRIDADRLIDLFCSYQAQQQQRIQQLEKSNAEFQQEMIQLRKQLGGSATKIDESYSIKAEEKRQEARGSKKKKIRKESKKQRRGRIANEEKLRLADESEDVFPDGVAPDRCQFSHVRLVWRIRLGTAVRVAYRIFRGPKKQYGVIPGVLGRSEFGLEIVLTLAYLIHVTGVSFDKACLLLKFFQQVNVSKSQADALLHQLARHWESEFEILCALLANSLVVNTDETGWSIHSVWVFLSEKARILLFGVHKDAATLQQLLDPETFAGLVISDDAAVYANFSVAQKCWAHLLRKAIKLTLQAPDNADYRAFCDGLLAIYRQAQRVAQDKRLSEQGRKRKVAELVKAVRDLVAPVVLEGSSANELAHQRYLLANEVLRLALRDELFTFVVIKAVEQPNGASKPVGGTNNEAERANRQPAQARQTGRTSKTSHGARRTSILTSVLESLRLYLVDYTLRSVLDEIKHWQEDGRSCFRALLDKLKIELPEESVLDQVFPNRAGAATILPEPDG
jgi:transposase